MARKKKQEDIPKVHEELQGFDLKINAFGEIESNMPMDRINEFLDKKLHDKKLNNLPTSDKLLDKFNKDLKDKGNSNDQQN